MHDQEAFDRMLESIRKQNRPSVNEEHKSLYRGLDNCRDPVGHLIPDYIYFTKMEGLNIKQLLGGQQFKSPLNGLERRRFGRLRGLFRDVDHNMLLACQKAHDRNLPGTEHGFVKRFEDDMRRVALDFGLKFAE